MRNGLAHEGLRIRHLAHILGCDPRQVNERDSDELALRVVARNPKTIVLRNRGVYAGGDAFAISQLQVNCGHRNFFVDGRSGVPHGLHASEPGEFRFKLRVVCDPPRFGRAKPAGPDGGHGELSAPFEWQFSGEAARRQTRSWRRDVVLSCGSHCRLEARDDNAAHRPCARIRVGIQF
jgi:hypothetical protein